MTPSRRGRRRRGRGRRRSRPGPARASAPGRGGRAPHRAELGSRTSSREARDAARSLGSGLLGTLGRRRSAGVVGRWRAVRRAAAASWPPACRRGGAVSALLGRRLLRGAFLAAAVFLAGPSWPRFFFAAAFFLAGAFLAAAFLRRSPDFAAGLPPGISCCTWFVSWATWSSSRLTVSLVTTSSSASWLRTSPWTSSTSCSALARERSTRSSTIAAACLRRTSPSLTRSFTIASARSRVICVNWMPASRYCLSRALRAIANARQRSLCLQK